MLRIVTAGESHGKALTAIIEGMPSGVKIDRELISSNLHYRKIGYGRGARQKIEDDEFEFLSGVRNNVTLGSPITILVKNKDYENWQHIMGDEKADLSKRTITCPRPGHADFVGAMKYGHDDIRNVLERASARETAIRVAACSVVQCMLNSLGIRSASYTVSMLGVEDKTKYDFEDVYKSCRKSLVGALDEKIEKQYMNFIDKAKSDGDTLGAKVKVIINGVKSGLGSYVQYDKKIDANLAFSLMSVQAVKAVEIGEGVNFACKNGSELLDEIYIQGQKIYRKTNHGGGIEGGMTNGEDIILTVTMKPIPTLMRPLDTIDIKTKQAAKAAIERSDVAVPLSLCIICECVACFEIAKFILEETGKSNFSEVEKAWKNLRCNLT